MKQNINNKIECYLFKDGCFYPSKYKYTLDNLDFDIHDTHGSATKINEKGFYPELLQSPDIDTSLKQFIVRIIPVKLLQKNIPRQYI
mgnify:CR=1 FL=1